MYRSTRSVHPGSQKNVPSSAPRPHGASSTRFLLLSCILLPILSSCRTPAASPASTHAEGTAWYKGNLHSHSLWSDGDDYPEMIVDWYREHGYDFLAISDHNTIMEGEKWVSLPDSGDPAAAFDRYAARFDDDWVEVREVDGARQVRLKTYSEFKPRLEVAGRFLLIRSEEISDGYDGKPVHLNATNIQEYIEPQGGNSILEVMQNNVDAVLAQRRHKGVDILPHVNHPNFVYAVSAENLIALEGDRFFEVYNGHPLVNNHGDHEHPSTERIWDLVLAHRLGSGREVMYGLATDDAHHYHHHAPDRSNPGRGWVMVRATSLQTQHLLEALERGDFYASTGVTLDDVRFDDESLHVIIRPENGVTFVTQFIGTRAGGFSPWSADGGDLQVDDEAVGVVLSEVSGPVASYAMRGDELYVRARIVSSRDKSGAAHDGEREMAWTQPVQPR